MLTAYRPLFAVPGARRFIAGAALSRVGAAMFGVAVIVMVSSRHGSYALAGLVAAAALIVLAISSPLIGALVDRYGQRRAALPFLPIAALCGYATAVCSATMAPVWTIFLFFSLSALQPEAGPMVRARWAHIYRDDPERLHTAMSFEQVSEELSFVIGPVLGVMVSTMWFPEAGLILAQTLYAAGLVMFLLTGQTEPPIVPHADRPSGWAIQQPGMVVVPTILVLVGVIFGANEVVTVAVAEDWGVKSWSSLPIGAIALGSAVSALAQGTIQFKSTLTSRLAIAAIGMFVLEAPTLIAPNIWWLTVIMLIAGIATAPMLITALSLVQKLVPKAFITEGMSVAVTGIIIGVSMGTSLGGWAVEHLGAQTAYVVPVGAGALATVISLLALARLKRAEAASPGTIG